MTKIKHQLADSLPYNAEVEWLMGTGEQYINTGIQSDNEMDITICVIVKQDNSLCWFFGAEEGSIRNSLAAYVRDRTFTIFNVSTVVYLNFTNESSHVIKTGKSGIFTDGTFRSSRSGNLNWFGNILVFTANRGGVPNLSETSEIKISSFSIQKDGNTLLDLIPVRFTNNSSQNEGAMYDKVSGQLFRNAGTSAFVIGPDRK